MARAPALVEFEDRRHKIVGLPHWPKRSAKLGANFFQLCFVKKKNWANQQELEKKKKNYRVPNQMASFFSGMNIEEVRATLNAGLNQTRAP